MAEKKKIKLTPSAYSTPQEKPKSNVNDLGAQTPSARKKAQAARKAAIKSDGTANPVGAKSHSAVKQTFKVSEGPKKQKVKKKRLEPTVYSDDITPEEAERQRKERERAAKREQRKIKDAIRRNKVGSRILYVVLLYVAIIALVYAVLFLWFLPQYGNVSEISYSHQDGSSSSTRTTTTWSVHEVGDTVLIDMTRTASLCDIATTGDGTSYRYVIKDTGDYMEFTPGLTSAVINGEHIRMTYPAVYVEEHLYVPVSFTDTYLTGVSFTLNESNNRIIYAEDEESSVALKTLDFETSESIIFTSLDYDLQEAIIALYDLEHPVVDPVVPISGE